MSGNLRGWLLPLVGVAVIGGGIARYVLLAEGSAEVGCAKFTYSIEAFLVRPSTDMTPADSTGSPATNRR